MIQINDNSKEKLLHADQPVRGRFAPTPSGRMHLGNVLCALIAWLSVRSQGGTMVLRIEDLDLSRTKPEFTGFIEEDLLWLGIDWDEGGVNFQASTHVPANAPGHFEKGGPFAPYQQSQCFELYEVFFERLQDAELVYPCFCSRAELHSAQAPHLSDGQVRYRGQCRNLSPSEIQEKSKKKKPASRLRVPNQMIRLMDGHYGFYQENLSTECGDFIIRRSDGVYAYQLAVVADDARMKITEVVRGRDLLSSAPRQFWLHQLLGFQPPNFYHIPLLLSPDGKQLSKRDQALDLGVLRQHCQPEELIGLLAFCCGLTEHQEPLKANDLIPLFSWNKIPHKDLFLPVELF